MYIEIGGLRAGAEKHSYCGERFMAVLGNSKKELELRKGSPILFELEKRGAILKLHIDGATVLVARKRHFRPGRTIVLNVSSGAKEQSPAHLHFISGKAL